MYEVHATSNGPTVYHIISFTNYIIETFAVEAKSDLIYFVDTGNNSLKRYDIISRQTSTLTTLASAKGNISKEFETTTLTITGCSYHVKTTST